jgi:hypothetical protein
MYTSLSNHLNNTVYRHIDVNINEGLFDKLFGGNGQAKGVFGFIGNLFSALSKEDDPLSKALKEQEVKAEANAKTRENELIKSAEGAMVAKLNADFEQRENQLTLANKRRVAAYKAQERQFREDATFWKNNKREYTAEQLDGFNRKREELFQGLGSTGNDELIEFNQLATIITTDSNTGDTLSIEDIRKKSTLKEGDDGYDPEFAKNFARFNELGKKYKKPLIESAKSDEFFEAMKIVPVYANEYNNAKTELDATQKIVDDFTKKSQQVATFNEKQKAHEEAQAKLTKAQDAVNNFGADSNGLCDVDGNDNVVIDTTKLNIDFSTREGEDKQEALNTRLEELRQQGIPESVLNRARAAYANAPVGSDPVEAVNNALKSDESKSEIEEGLKTHYQKKYDEAVAAKDQAAAAVSATPKPDLSDPEFVDIKDLDDEQRLEYDVTTEVGKKNKTDIEKELKTKQTKIADIEKTRNARKEKAKAVHNEYKALQKGKVPEELQDAVNKAKQGITFGETKNKEGKIGVETKDGFLEKPGPNATPEEIEKYDNAIDELAMSKSVKDLDPNEIIKKGDKYYQVIGKDEMPMTEQEAVQAYAENAIKAEQRAELLDRKQKFADNIAKCIKDGDLDPAAYKALSKAERATLKKVLSGELKAEDVFAGVDLSGSATLDKVIEFKKSHDNLDDKDSFDEYMKDIDDADDIETGEGSDADHDDEDNVDADEEGMLNDDGELETDEDEEYTDEEGNTQTRKKKLKNPAKIWRRKKKKNGKGTTSSYYNKEGDSISKKEFKKRMATYKAALNKKKEKQTSTNTTTSTTDPQRAVPDNQSAIDYTTLRDWLFERLMDQI